MFREETQSPSRSSCHLHRRGESDASISVTRCVCRRGAAAVAAHRWCRHQYAWLHRRRARHDRRCRRDRCPSDTAAIKNAGLQGTWLTPCPRRPRRRIRSRPGLNTSNCSAISSATPPSTPIRPTGRRPRSMRANGGWPTRSSASSTTVAPRCYVVRITAQSDLDAALAILATIDEITMVAAPGLTSATAYTSLIAHCELLKDRVAILDGPETDTKLRQRRLFSAADRGDGRGRSDGRPTRPTPPSTSPGCRSSTRRRVCCRRRRRATA